MTRKRIKGSNSSYYQKNELVYRKKKSNPKINYTLEEWSQCRILMQKNNELKEWRFRDSNERDREISKMLHEFYEVNA